MLVVAEDPSFVRFVILKCRCSLCHFELLPPCGHSVCGTVEAGLSALNILLEFCRPHVYKVNKMVEKEVPMGTDFASVLPSSGGIATFVWSTFPS